VARDIHLRKCCFHRRRRYPGSQGIGFGSVELVHPRMFQLGIQDRMFLSIALQQKMANGTDRHTFSCGIVSEEIGWTHLDTGIGGIICIVAG
jgi:hypothetical protein